MTSPLGVGTPVLIFDTFGGLCNQMMDIRAMVSFAVHHGLRFCFRNCAFRNADLVSWHPTPFSDLFNEDTFKKIPGYQDYADVTLPATGVWNASGSSVTKLLGSISDLDTIIRTHDFVVLKHFWPIFDRKIRRVPIDIFPSTIVLNCYNRCIVNIPNEYNFLHYRYETDFTNHFSRHRPQSKFPLLKNVLKKNLFALPNLPIYLGTSRPADIAEPHLDQPISEISGLFFTDELLFCDMNYEAAAYVDFLIGLSSIEVSGHSLSSFSEQLNREKGTRNFYDVEV